MQIPLSFRWPVFSMLLVLLGLFTSPAAFAVGIFGLAATIANAITMASAAPLAGGSRLTVRALLTILCIAGPVSRSYARDFRVGLSPLRISGDRYRFQWTSSVALKPAADVAELTDDLRAALLARGTTVALTDGYQPYDLQVRTAGGVSADINLLDGADGRAIVGWKLGVRATVIARVVGASLLVILLLLFSNFYSRLALIAGGLLGAVAVAAVWVRDARRIPPLLELAADDVAARRAAGTVADVSETR
jgi:hypothetical protein